VRCYADFVAGRRRGLGRLRGLPSLVHRGAAFLASCRACPSSSTRISDSARPATVRIWPDRVRLVGGLGIARLTHPSVSPHHLLLRARPSPASTRANTRARTRPPSASTRPPPATTGSPAATSTASTRARRSLRQQAQARVSTQEHAGLHKHAGARNLRRLARARRQALAADEQRRASTSTPAFTRTPASTSTSKPASTTSAGLLLQLAGARIELLRLRIDFPHRRIELSRPQIELFSTTRAGRQVPSMADSGDSGGARMWFGSRSPVFFFLMLRRCRGRRCRRRQRGCRLVRQGRGVVACCHPVRFLLIGNYFLSMEHCFLS